LLGWNPHNYLEEDGSGEPLANNKYHEASVSLFFSPSSSLKARRSAAIILVRASQQQTAKSETLTKTKK